MSVVAIRRAWCMSSSGSVEEVILAFGGLTIRVSRFEVASEEVNEC